MPCDPSSDFPAGVLRRAAAFALDVLFVCIVLSGVGSTAFALSDGRWQMDGLLPLFEDCGGRIRIPIPPEIDPAPELEDAAVACSAGPLPLVVSRRYLVVSVTTHIGAGSSRTFTIHPLSASGALTSADDLDWLGRLGFIAYLALGPLVGGRTIGMRLAGTRLTTRGEARRSPGVLIPPLLVRASIAFGGLALPALAFVRAFGIREPGLAEIALFFGIVGPIAWIATNVVLIASGRDPLYDRLAGLTASVVRS